LAEKGQAKAVIVLAPEASAPEKNAASELAKYLKEVTGAEFAIVKPAEAGGKPVIAVGPGAAKAIAPDLDLAKVGDNGLGDDGIMLKTVGQNLVLTGAEGSKRGTLYAVYEFLEREAGVRWWTPDAETVPGKPTLAAGPLDTRYKPPFLYREERGLRGQAQVEWSFPRDSSGERRALRYLGLVPHLLRAAAASDVLQGAPRMVQRDWWQTDA